MNVFLLVLWINIVKITKARTNLRIIGGRNATIEDLSFIVRLEVQFLVTLYNENYLKQLHVCSRSALTPTWTLTAAHCCKNHFELGITSKNRTEMSSVVRYGPVLDSPDSHSKADIISHVKHQFADIALLGTKPIHIARYARLSALDFNSLVGEEISVFGFGATNSTKNEMETTLYLNMPLQKLDVAVVKCVKKERLSLDPSHSDYPRLCIARRCGESAATCGGDSGGPGLHDSGIVGVNWYTMVHDCYVLPHGYRSHAVGWLTALSPYIDWIATIVNAPEYK